MEAKEFNSLTPREHSELGNRYAAAGLFSEAKACYEKSLALRQEAGDRRGESLVLNNLGALYHQRGLLSEALAYYAQALALARELGEKETELAVLLNQTLIYYVQGEKEDFLQTAGEAESLAQDMQRWESVARMKWLRGRWALASSAEQEKAMGYFAEALGYAQREDVETLRDFVEQVEREIRSLAREEQEGWARVFCDYLVAAGEKGSLGDEVAVAFTRLRQELGPAPRLFSPKRH